MMEMEDDMMSEDDSAESEPDIVSAALMEAFPEKDWTPEATEAFREAVRSCMDEYSEPSPPPKGKGKGLDLAIVLGGKPEKKK